MAFPIKNDKCGFFLSPRFCPSLGRVEKWYRRFVAFLACRSMHLSCFLVDTLLPSRVTHSVHFPPPVIFTFHNFVAAYFGCLSLGRTNTGSIDLYLEVSFSSYIAKAKTRNEGSHDSFQHRMHKVYDARGGLSRKVKQPTLWESNSFRLLFCRCGLHSSLLVDKLVELFPGSPLTSYENAVSFSFSGRHLLCPKNADTCNNGPRNLQTAFLVVQGRAWYTNFRC